MAGPSIHVHDIFVAVMEEPDVDHARHQIRDAAGAALTAALVPSVASVVHVGRLHPFAATEVESLVAVSVFTGSEVWIPDRDSMGDRQWRDLELVVEIRAKRSTDDSPALLAVLDVAALEAERALTGDATLVGLLQELNIRSTDTELESAGADQPIGVLRQVWSCGYRCAHLDPAVIV